MLATKKDGLSFNASTVLSLRSPPLDSGIWFQVKTSPTKSKIAFVRLEIASVCGTEADIREVMYFMRHNIHRVSVNSAGRTANNDRIAH